MNKNFFFTGFWTVTNTKLGISVLYENMQTQIKFDCGFVAANTLPELIMEFIVSEGDPNDFVRWDDDPPFQVNPKEKARA